ncbi:MAG: hypothetical protein AB1589_01970 [Cyanobacteriota bacterium]
MSLAYCNCVVPTSGVYWRFQFLQRTESTLGSLDYHSQSEFGTYKNEIPLLRTLLSSSNWVIGTLFKRKSLTGDRIQILQSLH